MKLRFGWLSVLVLLIGLATILGGCGGGGVGTTGSPSLHGDGLAGPASGPPGSSASSAREGLLAAATQMPGWDFWAAASAAMPFPSIGGAAAAINGKFYYLGGGIPAVPQDLSRMVVYDPALNTWSDAKPLPDARHEMSAAVINGLLYVAGGFPSPSQGPSNNLWVYDPGTNSWDTTKRPMPIATALHAGVGVINGMLYLAGGNSGGQQVTTTQVYDPSSDQWSFGKNLPAPYASGVSGVINGKLYIADPTNTGYAPTGATLVYDPAANSWTPLAPSATPYHPAGAVVNGLLYMAGGYDVSGGTPFTATRSITYTFPSFPHPSTLSDDTATPFSTPTTVVDYLGVSHTVNIDWTNSSVGGSGTRIADWQWSVRAADVASFGTGRAVPIFSTGHVTFTSTGQSTSLQQGFGIRDASGVIQNITIFFNQVTIGDGPSNMAAAADGSPGFTGFTQAVHAYNPATNLWSSVASMPAGHADGAAAAVNGHLYVAGGQGKNGVSLSDTGASTELDIYTPVPTAPTWPSGSMLTVSNDNITSLTLSWPAATSSLGVASYQVFQGSTQIGMVSGSTVTFDVTGLTPNTPYSFLVRAVDTSGNMSATGLSASATTLTLQGGVGIASSAVTALVQSGALSSGNGNSLTTKLNAVTSSLNTGNSNAASGQLGAFINAVSALVNSGRLTQDQSNALTNQAAQILSHL